MTLKPDKLKNAMWLALESVQTGLTNLAGLYPEQKNNLTELHGRVDTLMDDILTFRFESVDATPLDKNVISDDAWGYLDAAEYVLIGLNEKSLLSVIQLIEDAKAGIIKVRSELWHNEK